MVLDDLKRDVIVDGDVVEASGHFTPMKKHFDEMFVAHRTPPFIASRANS